MNSSQLISHRIVGSIHCMAAHQATPLYEAIVSLLENGKQVVLSFEKIEDLTSAFLNEAIGRLYGQFDQTNIRALLSVDATKISKSDLALLKTVTNRAKSYFSDPDRITKQVDEEFDSD